MRPLILCAAVLLATAPACLPGDIASYRIREGTLSISDVHPAMYLFRSEGVDERYDTSARAFLEASGVEFPGIPGLYPLAGIVTPQGPDLREEDKELVETQLPKEGRDKLRVFKTEDGSLFYIARDGETPVIRVDIVYPSGRKLTLWSRRQQ
jgi:hypothetical protein